MAHRRNNRTLHQLEQVLEQRRQAQRLTETLTTCRDLLIISLHRQGMSLRQVAEVAGMHFTRVRQLVAEAEAAKKRS